jgi:hypothetical protein
MNNVNALLRQPIGGNGSRIRTPIAIPVSIRSQSIDLQQPSEYKSDCEVTPISSNIDLTSDSN